MMLEPLSVENKLRELEISVSHRCTLACHECGFLVPAQPVPQHGAADVAILDGLERLRRLGVHVERLVFVGGEPTMAPGVLREVAAYARVAVHIGEVEVVTNGLSPDRVDPLLLRLFDRLVISNYAPESGLVELWKRWAASAAPELVVVARDQDAWDQWTGDATVGPDQALELWRGCWYRKHCVTLERGRIFSCSRIPKFGRDEEGLALSDSTTVEGLREWLNADRALPSCATCVPMMGLESVPVAVQPDDRMAILLPRAIRILNQKLEEGRNAEVSQ